MRDTKELMSSAKFFESYSRWDDDKDKYETWEDSVNRVMDMHKSYYADKMSEKLMSYINDAHDAYKNKKMLGAQRALQFGGDQILKHQMKMYNCVSSYADRAEFFGEYFYILLCGSGAGFSVQSSHVKKLPKISNRNKQPKTHVIEDSIEGWATACDVLLASYFVGGGKHPEYAGRKIYFDTSKIRRKGEHISGGFKAPGPEPLRLALDKIEYLLQGIILSGEDTLRPIHVYDICMYAADAVLAGGVRRSATICLFSADDKEMANAKVGNWHKLHPQRARSNNSAVILRNKITEANFIELISTIKQFGEPGFVFVDDIDICFNPCVEIGMYPQINKVSGWQGCNLVEINGSMCTTEDSFYDVCRTASIMATLQAGYTDFKFVGETTKKIFEREALLGVSITGWMNNPKILFDQEILKRGANIVKSTNREVAKLIGINPAARTTCVKPAGNASVLLMTAAGIHPEHSKRYLRNVQMNKDSEVPQLLRRKNPHMFEESVWSKSKTDYSISFPVVSKPGSLYKEDYLGVKHLELVKLVQSSWVETGTDVGLCINKKARHNVSNTIVVDDWEETAKYLYANREYFAGVSMISNGGDKDFNQAPYTEILTASEIVKKYGTGAVFASGLIVDSHNIFDNLWDACMFVFGYDDLIIVDDQTATMKNDWVRRFNKFADNYFGGNTKQAEYCLKDVHLLHKWEKIQNSLVDVDWVNELKKKKYVDINTTSGAACAGVTETGDSACMV